MHRQQEDFKTTTFYNVTRKKVYLALCVQRSDKKNNNIK